MPETTINLTDPRAAELVSVIRRTDRVVLVNVLAAMLRDPAADALPAPADLPAAVAPPSELLGDPARNLTEVEAASVLCVTNRALQKWRYAGAGPRWLRIGNGRGRIVYPVQGLLDYLASVGHGQLKAAAA